MLYGIYSYYIVYKINCKQFCAKMKVYGFKNAKSRVIPRF